MNHPAHTTDPYSRIGANVNHVTRGSALELSVRNALAARELEIMAAAKAGSATAFDELQKRYSRSLFKAILQITRNREDAEDVLQDTFLRAYLALQYFQGRSSVYSWLMRIAINSALMVLRRRRTRPDTFLAYSFEAEDGYPAREITDSALNPEQLCELSQRSNLLQSAIENLEPKLRAPIEIQLSDESSMKEIANTLSISVAAAKARLYRARVHLAKRVPVHSGWKKHRSASPKTAHAPSIVRAESSHARSAIETRCKSLEG